MSRSKQVLCTLALAWATLASAQVLGAQTAPVQSTNPPAQPVTCATRTAQEKAKWAKSTHVWVANVFHTQKVDTRQTWCSIWETHGYDRVHKTEDFGRVLFTGQGLHPVAGSIVPGSGFAGGLGFNLARALQSKPLRFSTNIEARGSMNEFWEVGANVHIIGSSPTTDDRHINATLFAQHRALPELTYFGLGDLSSVTNESLYGLEDTSVGGKLSVPLPLDFAISGNFGGLWAGPESFHGSSTPSIEEIFTPANTPALNTSTTYVSSGVSIDWTHPLEQCLHCWFRTDITAGFQFFHEASGEPYSFRRFHVEWTQTWHPFPDFSPDLGTVSIVSRLVESTTSAGNSVPFYLDPTIGGTDIDNYGVVRSYRDYRFRAPNILTFQGEYTHPLYDPVGLLFFYDVGKVALERGDLGINHMRHSFGIGFTIEAGGAIVFKLYFAWAGREGTHTNYTGNTNNFAGQNATYGVFF